VVSNHPCAPADVAGAERGPRIEKIGGRNAIADRDDLTARPPHGRLGLRSGKGLADSRCKTGQPAALRQRRGIRADGIHRRIEGRSFQRRFTQRGVRLVESAMATCFAIAVPHGNRDGDSRRGDQADGDIALRHNLP
jgi:hypothetical protein